MADLPRSCQSRSTKDSRRYPERPIIGVGALILSGEQVVLVERAQEPLKGEWSVPGGVVKVGEELGEAVRREALEETGLEVKPVRAMEIFERILRDEGQRPEYHYVLIDYLCEVEGGELRAGDDASQAAWVSREELTDYALTEGTLAVIEKAFEQRRRLR